MIWRVLLALGSYLATANLWSALGLPYASFRKSSYLEHMVFPAWPMMTFRI